MLPKSRKGGTGKGLKEPPLPATIKSKGPLMNIHEIAKQANVSIATVSRVLNNKPNISPKTYKKVMDVLRETGYSPNAIARGLKHNSMNMIGIVVDDIRNLYRAHVIYHLEDLLSRQGYTTIVFNACTKGATLFSLLSQHQFDSLIFVGSSLSTQDVSHFIASSCSQKPVLMFNGYVGLPNVISVICDEARGMQMMADHIYRTGKRRFLYVNYGQNLASQRKLSGFRGKLSELNLEFSDSHVFEAPSDDFEGGCKAGQAIIDSGIPFDAVLCSLDLPAMGVIQVLRQYGYSIPADVSVSGFDNLIYGKLTPPFLTSVDGKIQELADIAVEKLVAALAGEEVSHEPYSISPSLYLGGTT